MLPETETTATTHSLYPDEGMLHLAGMVLGMINYVQFEYPPAYNEAVLAQFPDLYEQTSALTNFMQKATAFEGIELTDEDVYTLYICYDLMGRLFISGLYEEIIDGLMKDSPSPHPPETLKKVYQHSLSNIQPFLVATELYAKKLNKLPMLGFIKKKLERLPELN